MNHKIYSFENLEVWRASRKLVSKIYQITNDYPSEEKYGLVSQMRRAVISVSSNISEGTSKSSLKDQARFSEISHGSLMELLNETILSFDIGYISEDEMLDVRIDIDLISSQLSNLRASQVKRHKSQRAKRSNSEKSSLLKS